MDLFLKKIPRISFEVMLLTNISPVPFHDVGGLQISFTWMWTPTGEFLEGCSHFSSQADSAGRLIRGNGNMPGFRPAPIPTTQRPSTSGMKNTANLHCLWREQASGPNLEDRRLEVRPAYVWWQEMDLLRCSSNPIMSSRLVCLRFPQLVAHWIFYPRLPFHENLEIAGPDLIRADQNAIGAFVKLDDSPALAVLHPLEMRKYPLIHDLGNIKLGDKGSQKAKGTTPRRED